MSSDATLSTLILSATEEADELVQKYSKINGRCLKKDENPQSPMDMEILQIENKRFIHKIWDYCSGLEEDPSEMDIILRKKHCYIIVVPNEILKNEKGKQKLMNRWIQRIRPGKHFSPPVFFLFLDDQSQSKVYSKSIIEPRNNLHKMSVNRTFSEGEDKKVLYSEIGRKIYTIQCSINNLKSQRRMILNFAAREGYLFEKRKKRPSKGGILSCFIPCFQ